ncbi:hypothetical protein [Microvirga sp. TS319]|uniref:hypothetical protein n=1 Tax=Microvirga sp. TS319 TaxID=3241165 RepID=UPI00351A937B
MAERVLIDGNGIRVSKPGINVSTANLADLVLSIDMRVGQILGAGYAALGPPYAGNDPNKAMRDATITYGPFSRAPDLMLYVRGDDGYAYPNGCLFSGGGVTMSDAANFDSLFYIESCSIGVSSAAITGYKWPYNLLPVEAIGLYYILYRKPLI